MTNDRIDSYKESNCFRNTKEHSFLFLGVLGFSVKCHVLFQRLVYENKKRDRARSLFGFGLDGFETRKLSKYKCNKDERSHSHQCERSSLFRTRGTKPYVVVDKYERLTASIPQIRESVVPSPNPIEFRSHFY